MATAVPSSLNKLKESFRGCMVGALLGDCLGQPFESRYIANDPNIITKCFQEVLVPNFKDKSKIILTYTDDTVMTRAIAQSLIENKTFNAKDLAKRFTEDYYREPNRRYGEQVTDVFFELKRSNYDNVLEPAQSQFNGTGSYGNGASMRISPVSLFTFNQDTDSTINLAKNTSLITHAHQNGYNGAILLSLAIKKALQISNSKEKLDVDEFLDYLIGHVDKVESNKIYKSKLLEMKTVLKNNQLTAQDIAKDFGNYVTAPKSVPTAICAFLRALKPIKEYETNNGFLRTMHLAISIGGDTDTIASMAGAAAGAYYGINEIPEVMYKQCEGIDYTIQQADQLADIVENRG